MLRLLSDLPRKNCWTIAEWTGYVLAVGCTHEVTTGAGKFCADTLARKVPKRACGPVHRLGWSDWRRRHQARSQTSHYLRQAART
ncbi:hypothetical protein GCM10017674_68020 [Streptomyces gardneri]|uniref:Transposase IS701-like DDE domain-containing protein n=1 Tax=Streptomyces gardneri TaxID=66892 RepID=A0A4Y3RLJ3_9ACTN|nr:hypothetical protein SGA01_38440 [Streptomyces gardneri]GHH17275.1 hypothetical protein GCM10017674_68020 [Streptomyces gardneri]